MEFIFVVTAPMVKFLMENLQKSGCVVGDRFIKAVNCDKQIAGGYVRGEGVTTILRLYHLLLSFKFID